MVVVMQNVTNQPVLNCDGTRHTSICYRLKKYLVFVFSTSLQLLIPSITTYCSLVCHPGSAFHSTQIFKTLPQSALDWFKSYLSSRSFRVKCNNNFSSCHMWCTSRSSSWSSTVYLVHHPSQHSYFVTFLEPPLLRWRHTTLLFLSIGFWLRHHSAPAFSPEIVQSKYSLTPKKLLQKVFELILLGFSVLYNILKVYQNRSLGKVFFKMASKMATETFEWP